VLKWYGFYSTTTWDMYEKKSPLNFGGFGIKIFHLEGTGKSPLNFFLLNPSNMIRMTTASSSWTRLPWSQLRQLWKLRSLGKISTELQTYNSLFYGILFLQLLLKQ